jgi:uncharacterized protein YabE (DUF348 family)
VLRSAKYGLYGAVLAGIVGGSALWHTVDKSVTLVIDGQPRSIHTTASNVEAVLQDAGYHPGVHDLVAPAPSASVHDGSTVVLKRGRLLRLTVDGVGRDVWTTAPTVASAMRQLGYSTANFTSVSRSRRLPLRPTTIAVRTPKAVTVAHDGTVSTVTSTDATVGELLRTLHVHLGVMDMVSQQLTSPLRDGMDITVRRVRHAFTYETRTVPFRTERRTDSSLSSGTVKITRAGRTGQIRTTYAVVYIDGKLAGRTRVTSRTVRSVINRVETVGTGSQYSGGSVAPGSAQAIAKAMLAARGWGSDQFSCLVTMWNHESGWRVNAANPSGAYGIPQALPGSKMASAGSDWQTNPATQIRWGLQYISSRYGTPCGAWATWQAHGGWY